MRRAGAALLVVVGVIAAGAPPLAADTSTASSAVSTDAMEAFARARRLHERAAGLGAAPDAATTEGLRLDAAWLEAWFRSQPEHLAAQTSAAQLEIDAAAVERLLEAGVVAELLDTTARLLDGARAYLVPPHVVLPDTQGVVDTATALATWLQQEASELPGTVGDLLEDLEGVTVHIGRDLVPQGLPGSEEALADADALLVFVGGVLGGFSDTTLSPSLDVAFTAAGDLVSWADGVVQRELEGDGGSVYVHPPNVVADGPAATPVVPYPLRGPSPLGPGPEPDGEAIAGAPTVNCGMYKDETCAPPVRTFGGPVIRKPVVRVVFWGASWVNEVNLRAGVTNLFANMNGSAYQGILQQYYDTTGYIDTAVTYGGAYVDTTSPIDPVVTSEDAAAEAKRVEGRTGWRTSDSTVWVIALPPKALGDSEGRREPDEKCGYQGYGTAGTTKNYIVAVLDYPRPECMFVDNNKRGSLTIVAAHEYVGAVTNPFYSGWYDGKPQHLPDLCRAMFFNGPGGEWVSRIWSNGDNRCVTSFTPTFRYQTSVVTKPPGDAQGTSRHTRGHAHHGGVVRVKNVGTMPWLPSGSQPTYLSTANNACSRFYDKAPGTSWASCRRIRMQATGGVGRNEEATFAFGLRPDGSFTDNQTGQEQDFTLVTETKGFHTVAGGSAPSMTGIAMSRFAAGTAGQADYYAVGVAGGDASVQVTVTNTGTAPWHPNEVVSIGTPPGDPSEYPSSSWPKGPGGCRNCRAHRVRQFVAPGGSYTFELLLHIPPGAKPNVPLPTQRFLPVADVVRVSDGLASSGPYMTGGQFNVTILVVPKPLGSHEVVGYGIVSSEPAVTTTADLTLLVDQDAGTFTCVAVAELDAVHTSVEECSATVTRSDGSVTTQWAASTGVTGSLAATTGTGLDYEPGDSARVCWRVAATFLDGTVTRRTACTA